MLLQLVKLKYSARYSQLDNHQVKLGEFVILIIVIIYNYLLACFAVVFSEGFFFLLVMPNNSGFLRFQAL